MATSGDDDPPADPSASARGWHGVQLAVIGFIGICGTLEKGSSSAPRVVQLIALVLMVAALVCACAGVALVATVAWPLSEASGDVARAGRRLRRGVLLSFGAAALTAIAATSGWWPHSAADAEAVDGVEVVTQAGSWCGTLTPTAPGQLAVRTDSGTIGLNLAEVQSVSPVDSCS